MSDVLVRLKRLFRLRFAVLYPLGVYVAFFATSSESSILVGLAIMFAGMLMRLWSNGYAIKMDKLTTSGPYAFVRNPLYIGTGLIILGVVVMLQILFVGVAFFVVLALVYARTIRNEQRILTEKFGKDFQDYCARVPAMWPTFRPYPGGEKWPFCFKRLWESREHKVFLWVGIIVIAFYLKSEFMTNGASLDVKTLSFIAGAFVLGFVDLVSEVVRYRQKKG